MLKQAMKLSILPSVAVTVGNIPRIIYLSQYNKTYPPILFQVGLCFAVVFITSFSVSLIIEWIKSIVKSKQ